MLHIAQKPITTVESFGVFERQQPLLPQQLQHLFQRWRLEPPVAATANNLEGLSDKFNLAYTTRTALDITHQTLSLHFPVDHRLHAPQGFKGTEIEVLAVGKGSQHRHQPAARRPVAGHHPRLDHGVALPVASLGLVVLFHSIEVEHQRATLAVGP